LGDLDLYAALDAPTTTARIEITLRTPSTVKSLLSLLEKSVPDYKRRTRTALRMPSTIMRLLEI